MVILERIREVEVEREPALTQDDRDGRTIQALRRVRGIGARNWAKAKILGRFGSSEASLILAPRGFAHSWLLRRDPGRVGSFDEQGINAVALTLKIGEHAAVEFPCAGELDPHRIDEMAIHYDFEM